MIKKKMIIKNKNKYQKRLYILFYGYLMTDNSVIIYSGYF